LGGGGNPRRFELDAPRFEGAFMSRFGASVSVGRFSFKDAGTEGTLRLIGSIAGEGAESGAQDSSVMDISELDAGRRTALGAT